MALETLKGIKEIGGFKVVDMDAIRLEKPEMFRPDGSMHYHIFEKEIRPFHFIYVRNDVNSIAFTVQKRSDQGSGSNGVQVGTFIETAKLMLEGLNKQFPCRENSLAITKLEEALHWLDHRTKDRERRGVEGESKI